MRVRKNWPSWFSWFLKCSGGRYSKLLQNYQNCSGGRYSKLLQNYQNYSGGRYSKLLQSYQNYSGGRYSKLLQSYQNYSVTIENLQYTINNLVSLLFSKDFKLLVGILYAIYSNKTLTYCILFHTMKASHTNAVREFLTYFHS